MSRTCTEDFLRHPPGNVPLDQHWILLGLAIELSFSRATARGWQAHHMHDRYTRLGHTITRKRLSRWLGAMSSDYRRNGQSPLLRSGKGRGTEYTVNVSAIHSLCTPDAPPTPKKIKQRDHHTLWHVFACRLLSRVWWRLSDLSESCPLGAIVQVDSDKVCGRWLAAMSEPPAPVLLTKGSGPKTTYSANPNNEYVGRLLLRRALSDRPATDPPSD